MALAKTAMSFQFKVRSARRARQKIAFDFDFKLPFGVDGLHIHIVPVYQHVGAMNTNDLSNSSELACCGHSKSLGVLHRYLWRKLPA